MIIIIVVVDVMQQKYHFYLVFKLFDLHVQCWIDLQKSF